MTTSNPRTERTPKRSASYQQLVHCAKLIRREVSWFNGWFANEHSVQISCDKAALKVMKYLAKKR